MQRRATSKKRTQDPETAEGKQERETEAAVDTEVEQPAGDKGNRRKE